MFDDDYSIISALDLLFGNNCVCGGEYLDTDSAKDILNRMYGRKNAMNTRRGYIYNYSAKNHSMVPIRIIFNPPATIVFFQDGTKTVVKCAEGEKFDPYTGFCYAFTEHFLGSISHIKKLCRKISTGLPEASESIVEEEKDEGADPFVLMEIVKKEEE